MTNEEKNERIKAVEEQMAKLQKELEDIRNEKSSEWDFSAWNNESERTTFSVDLPFGHLGLARHWCSDKLHFILLLIKFKYCYDKDYEPDWNNTEEQKWFVCVDTRSGKYNTDWVVRWNCPSSVYFSTREIAQKCCDWLNAGCPAK